MKELEKAINKRKRNQTQIRKGNESRNQKVERRNKRIKRQK